MTPGGPPTRPKPRPRRRGWGTRVAALARWLHVYLSVFGLAAVLFFAATGLTLNHTDWTFGSAARRVQTSGRLDPAWVPAGPSSSERVARLAIVEHIRKADGVGGALSEFRIDDDEILVGFKGPGYAADAFVDRGTGRYKLTQHDHGIVAVMNDLHKGRHTGPGWSIVIDASAVGLAVISLTGLVLLLYLRLRRVPGLVVGLVGAVAIAAVWAFLVP